eukprot:4517384-Amphidinium_carterae.3
MSTATKDVSTNTGLPFKLLDGMAIHGVLVKRIKLVDNINRESRRSPQHTVVEVNQVVGADLQVRGETKPAGFADPMEKDRLCQRTGSPSKQPRS